MRCNAFDEGREGDVKQHHFVFGMVDDVDELLRMQTRVASVHHHAAARHGVIRFEVAVVVPSNRTHHTALFQIQSFECIGQFASALGAIGIGITKQRTMRFSRNHLLTTKLCSSVLQDARQEQGTVHHEAGFEHENLRIKRIQRS